MLRKTPCQGDPARPPAFDESRVTSRLIELDGSVAWSTSLAYAVLHDLHRGSGVRTSQTNYLTDDEYRLLQTALMANPASGDLIRESGGIRKIRWAATGRGKRGGLRVIYYLVSRRSHILLLTMYRKSEISDLTPAEVSALRALVESLEG